MQPRAPYQTDPWGAGGARDPGWDRNPWPEAPIEGGEEERPPAKDYQGCVVPGEAWPEPVLAFVRYMSSLRELLHEARDNGVGDFRNAGKISETLAVADALQKALDDRALDICFLPLGEGHGGEYSTQQNFINLGPLTASMDDEARFDLADTLVHEFVHYRSDRAFETALRASKRPVLETFDEMIADEREAYVISGYYYSLLNQMRGNTSFSADIKHYERAANGVISTEEADRLTDETIAEQSAYSSQRDLFPRLHYVLHYTLPEHAYLHSISPTNDASGEQGRLMRTGMELTDGLPSYAAVSEWLIEEEVTAIQDAGIETPSQIWVHLYRNDERSGEYVYGFEGLASMVAEEP